MNSEKHNCLRLLIIGAYGNMGKNHVRVASKYLRNTEHKLITCDLNKSNGTDYTDYKQAIIEIKPTHVVIAAPTNFHEEILDFCIEQKIKNVLVEKPIALCNCDKYLGLKYTRIMVGHTERFNPMVDVLLKMVGNKKVDTIICTRSGLLNDKNRFDLNTDLCVHDSDICQLVTRLGDSSECFFEKVCFEAKGGFCNIVVNINGTTCFLHADERSPFKRREIKVMGPGYIIEGDYINQCVVMNGIETNISKSEPLLNEYDTFITGKFTEQDLREAILNLRIVEP